MHQEGRWHYAPEVNKYHLSGMETLFHILYECFAHNMPYCATKGLFHLLPSGQASGVSVLSIAPPSRCLRAQ